MRQYYSNNKNYNAILESMAQIRQNQLNEQYGYHAEAMHGDEEEMEEGFMYEGEQEDDEEAQMEALAEMMDEALMELDDEDDNDNQMLGEEDDDDRRARRRARLRNALLIGAGLVATGGLGAAAAMGKLPGGAGQEMMQGIGRKIGGYATKAGEYLSPKLTAAGEALSGGMDDVTAAYQQGLSDAKQGLNQAAADRIPTTFNPTTMVIKRNRVTGPRTN